MKSLFQLCVDNLYHLEDEKLDNLTNYQLPRRVNKEINVIRATNEISEYSQFIKRYTREKKQDILISGSIQSGKTNELLFYCWWSIFVCRRKVIFVSRNINADREQLIERIKTFNDRFITNSKFYIRETTPDSLNKGIICILANNHQVKKIFKSINNQKYNLCIDEADLCIKSRKVGMFKIQEYFGLLEKYSKHQVSATATEFAIISTKKTLTDVFKLKEPKNYYGIKRIGREYITPVLTSYSVKNDSNIKTIYDRLHTERDRFCILHTTTKLKITQNDIMFNLNKLYPTMTIITYNGNGYNIKIGSEYEKENTFSQYKKNMRSTNKVINISNKIKLSDILGEISHHKRICIISGTLASRGISFVSSDYKLHLTDQYYNPSNKVHGEGLLQGIRLFGCYEDNPKLTLWITKQNWRQIKEQYSILRKYINGVKDSDNVISKLETIKTILPLKKMSRKDVMNGISRRITKDGFIKLLIGDSVYDYNISNEPVIEST